MATGLLIGLLLAIYLIGYIIFNAADGWFGWTDDMYNDDKTIFVFSWPISMWWAIAKAIRDRVEEAKETHDQKKVELAKIRIQAEKELADTMRSLEEEIEEETPKKVRRSKR